MKMCRNAIRSALALAGSKYRPKLKETELYARGVGHYLVLPRRDGGNRFLILAKGPLSIRKTRFQNIAEEISGDNPDNLKFHKLGILPRNEKVFRDYLPLHEDAFSGPSYVRKNGLLWVQPYYAVITQHVRESSYPGPGVTIREYCSMILPRFSTQEHENDVANGWIVVNLKKTSMDYVLREGDTVSKMGHYHEKPILDLPLQIIYEDEGLVVVNKPPSWPVHSAGGFRMNSLHNILYKTIGYHKLRTVHRLDRMTSGVLIIPKNQKVASEIGKCFISDQTYKQYVALVHGKFPAGKFLHDSPLETYNLTQTVKRPFTKNGGKVSASTYFELIAYDESSDQSLVSCQPLTGRTHQLRLHLSELGHPIVYDTIYGSTSMQNTPLQEPFTREFNADDDELKEEDFIHDIYHTENTDPHRDMLEKRFRFDPNCAFCTGENFRHDETEPMFICLHSYRYKVNGYEFVAELPHWAKSFQPQIEQQNIL